MSASLRQWESDPLFSAAEVVQDSADRMDSIFRMLLHEQSLVQSDSSDLKLLSSIEYHRRDLVTALGTTKWQLEDFERAVNLSALWDKSHLRENAISRHRQFIRAIREQIIHVEKSLEDQSMGDSKRESQWVNLNEQDKYGLALFLSGGNHMDQHTRYDSQDSSIMRRFLDSTTASGFDEKSDEIVELKTEEIEDSRMNGAMHVEHGLDSLEENMFRKGVSNYSTGLASVSLQESFGDKDGGGGSWNLEICDSNTKSFFSKSKLTGLRNRLDVLRFFGNLWPVYWNKMTRSSTKKQKDGEAGVDFDQRPSSSSYLDISHVEQGQHTASGFRSSQGLCFKVLTLTLESCSWFGSFKRRLQRSPYVIQVNRLPVWLISAISVTLIVLAILAFQVA